MSGVGNVPIMELYSMLTEARNQDLIVYANKEKRRLLSKWIGGETESVHNELIFESSRLLYVEQFLQGRDESHFAALKLGTLMGVVESLERIYYENNQTVWALERFGKDKTKHLPEVVQALETHGSMSHTELSSFLGMNPSTLTESMKKILNTGAVQSSTMGKFRIYSLSDAGLRYGKELRKKRNHDQTLYDILEQLDLLLQSIGQVKTKEAVKSAVLKHLDEGFLIHEGDTLQLNNIDDPLGSVEKFQVESISNEVGENVITVNGRKKTEEELIEATTNYKNEMSILDYLDYWRCRRPAVVGGA